MFIDNLYDFFKKINYRRILPVLLCPVLFLCSSISVFAAEVSPDAQNEWFLLPFNDVSVQSNLVGVFNETQGVYHSSGNLGSGRYLNFTDNNSGGVFPSVLSGHRYLLYYNLTCESDIDFNRIILRKEFDDSSSTYALYPLSVGSIVSNTDVYVNNTTTLSGIIDFVSNKTITFSTGSGLLLQVDPSSAFNGRVDWAFYLLDVTESSESEVSQIVTAINNQTNNIMNAGSSFGGTTSGILSGNDELSGYIDDYTQIEQTMHNNFESAQSALIGDFTGFTWGSLANTLSWTSDYIQQIYLSSGDFKMMIILPLLLGIALFFIGRGAIILSNSNKDN